MKKNIMYRFISWVGIVFLFLGINIGFSDYIHNSGYDTSETISNSDQTIANKGTYRKPLFYTKVTDSDGNTVDIATEMNLEYVKKENGKISAYNTDFVNGGKGTRYLIFDIPKETAEDSEIYFIFHGTTNDRYKDEVSSKNVYFSDYIEKRQ